MDPLPTPHQLQVHATLSKHIVDPWKLSWWNQVKFEQSHSPWSPPFGRSVWLEIGGRVDGGPDRVPDPASHARY